MKTNLVFFGSSNYSVPVLQKLIEHYALSTEHCILAVVTTPDKPVGRHLKLTPNPVKLLAQKNNIQVIENLSEIVNHKSLFINHPIALVAAFGQIIPSEILSIFNNQIYNIHPSLLPKYRGPSPLQQQILDGITETGVTLIRLDEKMDHGPIVAAEKDSILPDDTSQSLGTRLFTVGTDLFIKFLQDRNSYFVNLKSQDENLATYTHKLTRQDGFIPWPEFESAFKIKNLPAGRHGLNLKIERAWRAYYPWPGIWSINPEGKRVILKSLSPVQIFVP